MLDENANIQALRRYISELGLTRQEVAALLRVHERTVYRWLSGERPVDGAALLALQLAVKLRSI